MRLRREPGHVFDQAIDGLGDALVAEHVDALLHVGEGHVLGRRHDDGPRDRNVLHQADVDVARARRHVDQQEVQLTPRDLQDHLLQRIAGHRPAPDQRLAPVGEIADGHPFDAVFLDWDDPLLVPILVRLRRQPFRAGHRRNGRAVYIRIGQADLVAQAREGHGQVDGDRGFAHAALAGRDADDMADFLQSREIQVKALLGRRLRTFLHHGLHFGLQAFRQMPVQRRPCTADQILGQRVLAFRECQGHGDRISLNLNFFHHPQRNETLLALRRMLHFSQDGNNLFSRHFTRFISSSR